MTAILCFLYYTDMTLQIVIQKLESIQQKWHEPSTTPLRAFTEAYIIVTKNFHEALSARLFRLPYQVQKLDEAFAAYYVRATAATQLPAEWQTVVKDRKKENELFSLLLGANVHIHHDLPLALLVTVSEPKTFERDFFIVKRVFAKAIDEIVRQFYPQATNTIRAKILRIITLRTILRWRKQAWKNFVQLRTKSLSKDELLQQTLRRAQKIRRLEKLVVK